MLWQWLHHYVIMHLRRGVCDAQGSGAQWLAGREGRSVRGAAVHAPRGCRPHPDLLCYGRGTMDGRQLSCCQQSHMVCLQHHVTAP